MKKSIDNIKNQLNYSKAGKYSTYFYSYVFNINSETNKKLLKLKKRKKLYNDILQEEDVSIPNEDEEEIDPYYQYNIFDKDYNPKLVINKNQKNDKEFEIKGSCSYLNKINSKENEIKKIRKDLMNNYFNKSLTKYKYHLLHHNELENDSIEKKKVQPSCTRYYPKLDFVNKKLIYSIPFFKMSGRQPTILIKKIKKINDNVKIPKTCYNNKYKSNSSRILFKDSNHRTYNIFDDEKNQIISQSDSTLIDFGLKKDNNNDNSPLKYRLSTSLSLNNLTKRKSHSVLNSKNIIENVNENDKTKDTNDNSKIKKEKSLINLINKKIQMNNVKYMYNIKDKTNLNSYRSSLKSLNNNKINLNNTKPNMCGSRSCLNLNSNKIKQEYKGINFRKMLSREYLDKINKHKDSVKTMLTPNYSSIQENNIINVLYIKKNQVDKSKPKSFIGYNEDFTYDINKIYDKYNNHSSPRAFNIQKMTGRERGDNYSPLPTFMLRMYDRNSIDNFNETSLKMNNYINGSLKDIQSSFNDKKSFNFKLQAEELKRNSIYEGRNIRRLINRKIKMELDKDKNKNKIMKKDNYNDRTEEKYFNKTNRNKSWKNLLGEFYKINYDNLERTLIGDKIDGITLKSYKNSK